MCVSMLSFCRTCGFVPWVHNLAGTSPVGQGAFETDCIPGFLALTDSHQTLSLSLCYPRKHQEKLGSCCWDPKFSSRTHWPKPPPHWFLQATGHLGVQGCPSQKGDWKVTGVNKCRSMARGWHGTFVSNHIFSLVMVMKQLGFYWVF